MDVPSVALILSFPVEVLMKSAPAIIQTIDARATFLRLPNSPVAKIVLRCASPQAERNALTSLKVPASFESGHASMK